MAWRDRLKAISLTSVPKASSREMEFESDLYYPQEGRRGIFLLDSSEAKRNYLSILKEK